MIGNFLSTVLIRELVRDGGTRPTDPRLNILLTLAAAEVGPELPVIGARVPPGTDGNDLDRHTHGLFY